MGDGNFNPAGGAIAGVKLGNVDTPLWAPMFLDSEVAELLVPIEVQSDPDLAAAMPGAMDNPKGCTGAKLTFGYIASPKGLATVNCGLAVQRGAIRSFSLACPSGTTSTINPNCIAGMSSLEVDNFGILNVVCYPPVGGLTDVAAVVLLFEQDWAVATPDCYVSRFGSSPATWNAWTGVGFGLFGAGGWDITVLVQ